MRVLVTGADGFVGQHVVGTLLERGHEVTGGITGGAPSLTTLAPERADRVAWRTFDLRDEGTVHGLVQDADPQAVLHLAGLSSVAESWRDPALTFHVNVQGAIHLLLALRDLPNTGGRRAVVLVGSGEVYGRSGSDDEPLHEDLPLRPLSPYAASKAAQEMLGWALAGTDTLRLVHTRSFQQTGPGQRASFVAVDWAVQLLAIRDGRQPPVLSVGNLEIVRDFLDVRDAADVYVRLLESREAAGVFNVCSGCGVSLRELLAALERIVGVSVEARVVESRLRPAEIHSLVGSRDRLGAAVGWAPERLLEQTLADLIAFQDRKGS